MDPVGLPIAASVAGLANAERVAAREKAKENKKIDDRFKRSLDQADLTVTNVESPEAVRSAKGNDQEESHEDHEANAHYESEALLRRLNTPDARPRLDIEG